MTRDETEALAAEYVLGTLDSESRARFDRDMVADPALRKLVAQWERRLAPLADGVPPAEPPAGLWSKIESRLDPEPEPTYPKLPGTTTVHADEGAWKPVAEGVDMKLLWIDDVRGSQSFLLRLAPGTALPGHAHRLYEECLVMEGGIEIGPMKLRSGDYHLAHPGVPHPAITSAEGGLLFVRAEVGELEE